MAVQGSLIQYSYFDDVLVADQPNGYSRVGGRILGIGNVHDRADVGAWQCDFLPAGQGPRYIRKNESEIILRLISLVKQ